MDLFNDIGRLFTRPSSPASADEKTSSIDDVLKEARIDLQEAYIALGQACFETTIQPRAVIPEHLISRVRMLRDRVDSLAKLQAETLESVRCPSCGSRQRKGSRYCSNCGKRMPEDVVNPLETPEDAPYVEYCPSCGAMRHNMTKYCELCGHSFSENHKESVSDEPYRASEEPIVPIEEPEYEDNE